jgi:hypothetical protein
MYITFDGLALLNHFYQLFEVLAAGETRRQAACNSP